MADRLRRLLLLAAAASLLATLALPAGSAPAATGITSFTIAPTTTQAGGHPDFTFSATWLNRDDPPQDECLCDDARVIATHLPTGFIGNPHNLPTCTLTEFNLNTCPEASQLGIADFSLGTVPLYNLETHPDQAGLIGFVIPFANAPFFTDLSGRTESDYGLDSATAPTIHLFPIDHIKYTIWGVPADPSHTARRFHTPLSGLGVCVPPETPLLGTGPLCEEEIATGAASPVPPAPYTQNPTTCGVPLSASVDIFYYNGVVEHADYPWPATTGCQQLSFNPSLTAVPTTTRADTVSGIDVDLKVPQVQSPSVPSPSEIRSATLTLPEGFSINPGAADGKLSCTDASSAIGLSRGPATCPEFAKVGTLTIDSSALPGPIPGAIYLGQPKPGDRYRLILAADGFGTHVKLAGSVRPDPQTGQILTSFPDLPQSPLTEFNLHFFGSERGLLTTPTQCGTYPVRSDFVPWDNALPVQHSLSSFAIDSGPGGGPCPGPLRPFGPSLQAGVSNSTAGVHSPFVLRLDRTDGDQFLDGLSVTTPPGFSASLRGIPYCPESALAGLADPSHSGLAELASSACPPASLIGTALATAGPGTRPLLVDGRVYLAGPYGGSPLSLVVVIPAVSGPYDLGNVAVRARIDVDPLTAQVTTRSDPLPRILDGIQLRVRSVQVDLDRPGFALNPTNCDPLAVDATILGDQGALADPSARFQVSNCGELPYSPGLALRFSGGLNRRGHPAIRATFTARPGEANTRAVSVTLPRGELLDNAHIGTVCTRVDFAADACPPSSQIGTATVVTPLLDQPLSGPVFLRSSNSDLPDIAVDLSGQFDFELALRVDTIDQRFRTTLEKAPDVPIGSFVLELAGGRKGLLQNTESLCPGPKRATAHIVGQNGAVHNARVPLRTGCRAHPRHRHGSSRPLGEARR